MSSGMRPLNAPQTVPTFSTSDEALHVPPRGVVLAQRGNRLRATLKAVLPGGGRGWARNEQLFGEDILDAVVHDDRVALRMWRPGLGVLEITDESCLRALLLLGGSRRQRGTVIAWGDPHDSTGYTWSAAVLTDPAAITWTGTSDSFTDEDDEAALFDALRFFGCSDAETTFVVVPV